MVMWISFLSKFYYYPYKLHYIELKIMKYRYFVILYYFPIVIVVSPPYIIYQTILAFLFKVRARYNWKI